MPTDLSRHGGLKSEVVSDTDAGQSFKCVEKPQFFTAFHDVAKSNFNLLCYEYIIFKSFF
jgi:hypothetical protein